MIKICPYCSNSGKPSEFRPKVVRAGRYRRTSDCRIVQRYLCRSCSRHFSNATGHPCFGQKKRHLNVRIQKEVCSAVSFREIARKLRIHRETVKRKVVFLGLQAELELERYNRESPLVNVMEFDDMETFEHTKCKPLSITLAVEHKTRRILGLEVSQMPAKGRLARISVKKYGPRADHRAFGRNVLSTRIQDFVSPNAEIRSDENPHYPATVRAHFPLANHVSFKGQRGSIVGQGELKKVRFDPLFSLNHTCAMIRDNLKRMTRRTWCTTKSPQMLRHCLAIYVIHHNLNRIVDD